MTLSTLRTAIATALDGIAGVRATAVLTDQVVPPAGGGYAMVEFDEIDYNLVFGGTLRSLPLTITVYAQRVSERTSQLFLDTLRDPNAATCVKTVLESDSGVIAAIGTVGYLQINKALKPVEVTVGDVAYLALEFQGEVVAS